MTEDQSPYQQGYAEACNPNSTITCPYADGTVESDRWWDGFSDGLEDFIAYQRS